MSDEAPDLIAAVDQWARNVKEYARVVGSYHAALLEHGFTREEAFALALAYQNHILPPR